jgi:hypothetical protein
MDRLFYWRRRDAPMRISGANPADRLRIPVFGRTRRVTA